MCRPNLSFGFLFFLYFICPAKQYNHTYEKVQQRSIHLLQYHPDPLDMMGSAEISVFSGDGISIIVIFLDRAAGISGSAAIKTGFIALRQQQLSGMIIVLSATPASPLVMVCIPVFHSIVVRPKGVIGKNKKCF
jgi:hypothetical protein